MPWRLNAAQLTEFFYRAAIAGRMACPATSLTIKTKARALIAVFVVVARNRTRGVNLIAVDFYVLGMDFTLEPIFYVGWGKPDFTKAQHYADSFRAAYQLSG